jgi:transcriptional regulator with XRE-family HTH domain
LVGSSKYTGTPAQAARLHAARLAAGYASATEAARKFGWSEPRYRSNESAARGLSEAAARTYGRAFGVSAEWLLRGPERGGKDEIEVDPLRVRQLKLKVESQAKPVEDPQNQPAGRLRLARRIAGYRSAATAARELGIHRSTLNAQERGLSGVDRGAARRFGSAFGCEPEWLLTGRLPSGYSEAIEQRLRQLLADHDLPESEAATRLPAFSLPTRVAEPPRRPSRPGGSAAHESVDRLPEYDPASIAHDFDPAGPGRPLTVRTWSMPEGFVSAVLHADPSSCALVAVGDRAAAREFGLRPGDRLIVDTSVRDVHSAAYMVADRSSVPMMMDAHDERQRAELTKRLAHSDVVLIGQIVGVVANYPGVRRR